MPPLLGVAESKPLDPVVFISSISGFPQFNAENTKLLRDTGKVSLAVSALTLGLFISNPQQLSAVTSHFSGSTGSIGLFHDKTTTPSLPQYRFSLGHGDGHTKTFNFSLGKALSQGHVQITQDATIGAKDDGNGNIEGKFGKGKVNYSTGHISFTFLHAPPAGNDLRVGVWLADNVHLGHVLPFDGTHVWDYGGVDDWPAWLSQIKWSPAIAFLNLGAGHSKAQYIEPLTLTDLATATSDIKKIDPQIKSVYPYISPNTGVYGDFSTSKYWENARKAALQQGGLLIDAPAGRFLICPEAYRQTVASEIRWANKHGLVTIIELSPFALQCPPGTICQFDPDNHFMSSVQQVVAYLQKNSSLPNVWFIDQYSQNPASPQPGTDDESSAHYNPNTINAIAMWALHHAPTTPYPVAPHR